MERLKAICDVIYPYIFGIDNWKIGWEFVAVIIAFLSYRIEKREEQRDLRSSDQSTTATKSDYSQIHERVPNPALAFSADIMMAFVLYAILGFVFGRLGTTLLAAASGEGARSAWTIFFLLIITQIIAFWLIRFFFQHPRARLSANIGALFGLVFSILMIL